MKKLLSTFAVLAGLASIAVASVSSASPWSETFDGAPASPQAWSSPDWDIQYHHQQSQYWDAPPGMQAQHGGDCSGPPSTHAVNTWPGTVFQCNNHVMTALNADYGVIYLTPNRMADWSSGPAVIQWEMSTEDVDGRDWPDVIVTPWEWNQATPLISNLSDGVDLQGPPRYAVHVGMENAESIPSLGIVTNGFKTELNDFYSTPRIYSGIDDSVNQAASRQTFRLTLTSTSAKFERLESATAPYVLFWDETFADIGYTQGIVQWGHHSYNPGKDGGNGPQTWHWDNMSINPSVPFTLIKSDQRYVQSESELVTFDAPAPANAFLRFAALGNVQVSFDGGAYVTAERQWEAQNRPEGASSFWTPIPEGTQTVRFRFNDRSWYSGPFIAKDFAIWSTSSGGGSKLPAATPTRTSTPAATATTAPRTATATPTRQSATNTPTPVAPTATPTTPSSSSQSWDVTASTSSQFVNAGSRVAMSAQAKPSRSTTVLVDLEVYDPQGRKVFQQYWDRRSFREDRTRGFSALWRLPNSARPGTYTVKVGIFGVRWDGLQYWNDSATTFTVR